MQYHPTRDQRNLAAMLEDALIAILPLERLHTQAGESETTWSELEALGLFGLSLPESEGGSGLGAAEEVLAAAALGRRLANPCVFARLGAAHARRGRGRLPASPVSVAFAGGSGPIAVHDPLAHIVLVREPDGAALYELSGEDRAAIDSPWLDRLVRLESLSEPLATFDDAGLLRLRLIDAAALAGVADAALRAAVAYAGVREQFGRPIGSFQAVKHHCADMAVRTREALDLSTFAAVAIDQRRPEVAFLVDSAFVSAATAALFCAGKNIQIHGGIGFSEEADAHLALKRTRLLTAIGGGLEPTLERLGAVADLSSAAPPRAWAME